jgi:hypothetical protein
MNLLEISRSSRVSMLCLLGWAGACSSGDHGNTASERSEKAVLVEPDSWTLTTDADDPFAADKPDGATCDSLGYGPEDYEGELALFVDTGACDFATFEQPALAPVAKGERVRLRLYHYDLTAPEAAQAHVALLFGNEVQWQKDFDIPSGAELVNTHWKATRALEKGDPVRFHVGNHGDNNWVLLEVSRDP